MRKRRRREIGKCQDNNAVTLADGTELPKGTKLIGKVTEVRAKSNSDKTSHVAFSLEQAVTKDGHEISLQVMVTSLTVPMDNPDLAAVTVGCSMEWVQVLSSTAPTTASNPNQTYVE